MQGKVALVTGGTGGIGTAIAQRLADEGAKVAVTYNKDGNHDLAKEWKLDQKNHGYDFSIHYCDVADFESSAMAIHEINESLGKIDILVNNAGITKDTSFKNMLPDDWHTVISSNLHSMYNITRNVLVGMLDNLYGRIINIASINGQKGQFGQVNYSSSKAGVIGFTKALAYEVARKNITVNTVSPGYINTRMLSKVPENIMDKIRQQIPMGRLGNPEEVADLVAFLASDKSSYITGANLSINGGQYME